MSTVLANRGLDSLISFETDAIFTRAKYNQLEVADMLGDWEETELSELTYLQSGFYAANNGEASFGKMRGRSKTKYDPDDFKLQLQRCINDRAPLEYSQRCFVGMGKALSSDWSSWRTWQDFARKVEPPDILVETSSKRVHDILTCPCDIESGGSMADRWHTTFVPPILSAAPQRPYEIAWEGRIQEEELWETF